MAISRGDVEHAAQLARLELSAEEVERFTRQLDAILEYVDQLKELDTEKVEPRISAAAAGNVFRADEPRPGLGQDVTLSEAPSTDGEHFLVPPIIEGGPSA